MICGEMTTSRLLKERNTMKSYFLDLIFQLLAASALAVGIIVFYRFVESF